MKVGKNGTNSWIPCLPAGPEPNMGQGTQLYKREEFPLFGKWFDETHHPELVEGEGLGEILTTIYFSNYALLSNRMRWHAVAKGSGLFLGEEDG